MAGFQRRSRADGKAYPQWHNAVAGAAAGAGSRFVTAPLDLLRIRRQLDLSRPPPGPFSGAGAPFSAAGAASGPRLDLFSSLARIAREEGGVRSLFRGNVAATYLWITYAAIQFSLYSRTSDAISAFAPGAMLPSVATRGVFPLCCHEPDALATHHSHIPWHDERFDRYVSAARR